MLTEMGQGALALLTLGILALVHRGKPTREALAPAVVAGGVTTLLLRRLAARALRRRRTGRAEASQASTIAVRTRQSIALPALVRRLVSRKTVDDAIDLGRLRLDAFPHGIYQPVPGLPVRTASRALGTQTRWSAMEPIVDRLGVQTAMDVGAAAGYFPLKLAERGIAAMAVESAPTQVRTAMTAVRRNRVDNLGVLALELRPDTVRLLPAVDCTIFLSIWHHIVRHQGLEVATQLMRELWARTGKVMFFDTGEDEMPDSFRLPPMAPTPREWLTSYLEQTCEGAQIEQIGLHAAFDADGLPAERNLFAVIRNPRP